MGKTIRSVSLDMSTYLKVDELAKRSFDRNFSKALNWIIKSVMQPDEFYKFMAKHHAGQMQHFLDRLEHSKEEKLKTPEPPTVYETVEI